MSQSHYIIRAMSRPEVDIAINWAAIEGWNPGLHDADSFYTADPSGFLIGLLHNEPIAVISAIKYGSTFGFIGFYIVKPEFRRQGYGIQIWNAGLKHLSGRTIGLDGVVDQQENYKKSGFALAYRNIRYCGVTSPKDSPHPQVVPLSQFDLEEIAAYDRLFFPDSRTSFLEKWIGRPQNTAVGIVQDNQLAGYGVIRACHVGYKVGPLFADDPVLADHLFTHLKSQIPEASQVFLDIPETNPRAIDLVTRHGMTVGFETARMYKDGYPNIAIDRLYGVTSFELG
jgi:ribosomal protein S18 acetylase RimI-like enzyme